MLIINSSAAENDESRVYELSRYFMRLWEERHPGDEITENRLADARVPHIDALTIKAFYTPEDQLDEKLKEALLISDKLIHELSNADALLFLCPMYNFSVPSILKAYFDLVARVGKTFEFTEAGPVGLLKNKKAYVITTMGGFYVGHKDDHQVPFLKTMLNFLGIMDITFFNAEGIDTSSDNLRVGMEKAKEAIAAYFQH